MGFRTGFLAARTHVSIVAHARAGLGRSDLGPPDLTPEREVAALRGALGSLGLPEPTIVVGHSYGAMMALLHAELFPEAVEALVLVHPMNPRFMAAVGDWLDTTVREGSRPGLFDIGYHPIVTNTGNHDEEGTMGRLQTLMRVAGSLLSLLAADFSKGGAALEGQAVYASLTQDMEEREYGELRGKLLAAAELMPENLYGFRAVPEIRTYGEELNHAADVNFRLCGLALGEDRPATPATSGPPLAKDDIVARLVRSLEVCDRAFDGMTDESALEPTFGRYVRGSHIVAMLGHGWHEYGKLTVLLRLNGVSPQPGG